MKGFLSYNWADGGFADYVDYYFSQKNVYLIRDKRDLYYTESIRNFAKKIKEAQFMVCLISDRFLKSENCMYEIIELLRDDAFESKICPIIIHNNKKVVLNPKSIEKYAIYWANKVKSQDILINDIKENELKKAPIKLLEEYKLIYHGIRDFMYFLKDRIYITNEDLNEKGIQKLDESILKKIGIKPEIFKEEKIEMTKEKEQKNEFLAKMSHEIRTPMNAIIGMTELALREEISDSV